MKTEMSSFDIMAMVGELTKDMRIKKIFQPTPERLRIQVRFKEGGTGNIVVEVGKLMYLSDYSMPSPRFPSNFVMTLRKHLSNSFVKEIRQVGFDRIVELLIEARDGDFKMVFELFGDGNVLLLDSSGVIKAVMKPRRFKHRDLVGRETYSYPPQRLNPFEISSEEIIESVKEYGSLVKALAIPLGLGGLYAEEVCLRAGIRKDAASLKMEESEKVKAVLLNLKEEALSPKPVIILMEGQPFDVAPTQLLIYKDKETKEFSNFNKALSEFFTERVVEKLVEKSEKAYREGLTTLGIRLREQAKAISRFNREIKEGKLIGDIILKNLDSIQRLIETIGKARKSISAKEIKTSLSGVSAVKQYFPKENNVAVFIDGYEFKLDLSVSASKNAESFYQRSKKAREKLRGAREASDKTKASIKEHMKKGKEEVTAQDVISKKDKAKKKKWYERFRWFRSSDGMLVLGGRDASSNEALVKRHMDKDDIFVHADIHGAPAVVIKGEGRKIPENTIQEACGFAASNSAAWKSNAAFLDVYWVSPEQVSKTPRSGEYVSKGAFIIRGKRNYCRSKIEIAVGVKVHGEEAEIMCGPTDAAKKNTDYYVTLVPGNLKSKEASEKIKELLFEMADEKKRIHIKGINLDDIQRVLPAGGYFIRTKP